MRGLSSQAPETEVTEEDREVNQPGIKREGPEEPPAFSDKAGAFLNLISE
jgi:hypothetical protein